ncbi:J domain-containing protein [Mesobacillus selenatarsenatis]|uniref:J domain-containing protein n=1 Tax=Mesobacillus selenatarsenatis TaxID=388741 RepID=A0A846TBI0_9BACI|nr:J domain-containing protein [Mesobacillus selenatarsenatis]NKE04159.1 J domain-containing protein [Mesobacillus selenatarsenatis]
MLTIKEAAEQLTSYGMETTEQEVHNWIKKGFLDAESDKINPANLAEFVIKIHTDLLEQSRHENKKLNEQLELLHTRLHIEQSKVRTLKKMLNAQIENSGTPASDLNELLGLKPNSNGPALKKEFKKILKALHPDRGGDERLFKVFKDHYEKLK